MWYIVLSRALPEQEESKQVHYGEHRRWLEEQQQSRAVIVFRTDDRRRLWDLHHGRCQS
jgi:hypothetical protein